MLNFQAENIQGFPLNQLNHTLLQIDLPHIAHNHIQQQCGIYETHGYNVKYKHTYLKSETNIYQSL